MLPFLAIPAGLAVVGALALAWRRQHGGPTAPAQTPPAQVVQFAKPELEQPQAAPARHAEAAAPPPTPGPVPPEGPAPGALLAKRAAQAVLGMAQGNVVQAGLAVSDFAGLTVETLGGGEGKGDVVRVTSAAFGPVLSDILTRKALDAIGVSDDAQRIAGQIAAAGPLAPSVAVVHALDQVLGLVSDDAQEVVHSVFREFDFTHRGTIPGQVVGAVGDGVSIAADGIGSAVGAGVKAIGGLLGIGGGDERREPADPARVAAGQAVLRAATNSTVLGPLASTAVQLLERQAALTPPPPVVIPKPPVAAAPAPKPQPVPFNPKLPEFVPGQKKGRAVEV